MGSVVGVEANVAVFIGAAPWALAGSVARTRARIVIRNTWSLGELLLYTGGNRRVGRSPAVSRVTPGGSPAHGPLPLPVADQSAEAARRACPEGSGSVRVALYTVVWTGMRAVTT